MAKKIASSSVKKKTTKKSAAAPAKSPAKKAVARKAARPAASASSAKKKSAKKSAASASASKPSASGLLEPGDRAPAFALPDQSGTPHRFEDYAGAPLILYFYPKDDTEDCTIEACAFNDRLPELGKVGAAVLGVSRLDTKSKAKFAAKHGLNFPLLADEDGSVSSRYGTWVEKSMYGKKFMAVSRTTYLIDGSGRVARRWDKVQVEGHAKEVMEALRAL